MARSWYSGSTSSYDITASTTSAGTGTAPDRRRLYDFSNMVKTLTPQKNPFFTYLSNVSKEPVSASVFRYLEDRTRTDWTSREFYLDADVNGASDVSAGSSYSFQVDDGSGVAVSWLIKGMVFTIGTVYSSVGFTLVQVRVTSTPSINSADTTFTGIIVQVPAAITGSVVLSDGDRCQVIGTSFQEATGSPDVWSSELEDNYGYTQILKTALEMSETQMTEEYRGYKNDWPWRWNNKLSEHLSDIERIALFSQKARNGNIQSTEGIVGHIIKNSTVNVGDTAFAYTSGKAYFRSIAQTELTYDRLLADMEVVFDPATSMSQDRLVLSSRPIVTFFNKVGDGAFVDSSLGYQYSPFRDKIKHEGGNFGHKVLVIETVNGNLHLVSEPMFRGNSRSLMVWVDLDFVKYRPLVGNGKSRDTFIKSNVQARDEDARKDQILTEFGIEVSLPETHCLYSLEGL